MNYYQHRRKSFRGGFDKTGLLAWYDFNDNTDSHGTYHMTETGGTPSYTGGYATLGAVSGHGLNVPTSLVSSSGGAWLPDTNTDGTLILAFRVVSANISGEYICDDNFQTGIRYITGAGPYTRVFGSAVNSSSFGGLTTGVDYIIAMVYDSSTDTHIQWINGAYYTTSTAAYGGTPIGFKYGVVSSGTPIQEARYYWGAFFNRKLLTEELSGALLSDINTQYTDL